LSGASGFDRVKSGSATLAASRITAALGQPKPRRFALGLTACCGGIRAVIESRGVGNIAFGIGGRDDHRPERGVGQVRISRGIGADPEAV